MRGIATVKVARCYFDYSAMTAGIAVMKMCLIPLQTFPVIPVEKKSFLDSIRQAHIAACQQVFVYPGSAGSHGADYQNVRK